MSWPSTLSRGATRTGGDASAASVASDASARATAASQPCARAASAATAPRRRRSAASAAAARRAPASASTETSWTQPCRASGMPPKRGAGRRSPASAQPPSAGTNSPVGPSALWITGTPQAIASSAGRQKPSAR